VADPEEFGHADAEPAGLREDADVGDRSAAVALLKEELAVDIRDPPAQPTLRLRHARLVRRLHRDEEADLTHYRLSRSFVEVMEQPKCSGPWAQAIPQESARRASLTGPLHEAVLPPSGDDGVGLLLGDLDVVGIVVPERVQAQVLRGMPLQVAVEGLVRGHGFGVDPPH
jgi:hypothetical protein